MGPTARRLRVSVVLALAAGSLLGAPASIRADDNPFAPFEDPGADAATILKALASEANSLALTPGAATTGQVTVCARNDAARSKLLADELAAMARRGADALTAAGWTVPDAPILVVRVKVRGSPSLLLASEDGSQVFVREGDGGRAMAAPVPPSRPEGSPIVRDGVNASRRARVWTWAQTSAVDGVSLPAIVSRRLLHATIEGGVRPPWFAEALSAWLEGLIAPDAPGRHACRSWIAPDAAAAVKLLSGPDRPPAGARPFLARFVGALLANCKDGPGAMAALVDAKETTAAAVGSAFGRDFAAAVAAGAVPSSAQDPSAPACDEQGNVGCGVCKAIGRIDLACPDCSGAGAICCPACLGSDSCTECTAGWQFYSGGKKVRCRLCTGGKTRCVACAGTLKAPCKSCNGTGRTSWPCPVGCANGKMPCPSGVVRGAAEPACPWCADTKGQSACGGCAGVSFLGCSDCFGTLRLMCGGCGATGETRMVYKDGTTASASKCSDCDGRGFGKCSDCKDGKRPCGECGGKGRVPRDPSKCPLCGGAGKLGAPGWDLLKSQAARLTDEDRESCTKMLESAQKFLMTCRVPGGGFALRKFRRGSDSPEAAPLDPPTMFSNSICLWTLALAGHDMNDPALAGAKQRLRSDAQSLIDGTAEYMGSQAAGLTLRALTSCGEDPSAAFVKGLVDRILKGQHGDGLWGSSLDDPKDPSDVLDTLFVAESLRLARLRGVKVPNATWARLLRAASSHLESRALSPKSDWIIGTDVASSVALVVMAKEGTLGSKAASFDYESIPGVRRGLAWLDRYFDIEREPQFSRGAKRAKSSDRGYMAYLFAIQRLGMLLSIEEIGGERWYAAAVHHLATKQFKDGSFEERSRIALNGPVRTTSAAILFLLRATPAVTDGSDD